jgi:hypothetical protein
MEFNKSQGPRLAVVAGSAALLCALLVGSAYFLRDDGADAGGGTDAAGGTPTSATWTPKDAVAASLLEPVIARCEEGSNEDVGGGRTKTRCTARAHPAFMLEVIGKGDEVERASLMVPMKGDMNKLLDRILVGVELFSLVAGTQADAFLSREYLDTIGTGETKTIFQGRMYMTQPIANVGLIFGVMPEPGGSPREN